MKNNRDYSSFGRRLKWLMFIRVVTTTFLLGTTIVVQFRHVGAATGEALAALYALIGTIYFLTFIYAVILPKLMGETPQAYVQIAGDVIITTGVIYLTGGIESTFSFMYILAIINSGIMLRIRGAVITASISSIAYGAMLDLHYFNYIHPYLTRFTFLDFHRPADILNTILVNMAAFYLVAFLSGYLSKQAEESKEQLAVGREHMRRLEKMNENIVQSIDSGLATLGAGGEILTFNIAAEKITRLKFSEIRGRHYSEVFEELELSSDPFTGRAPGETWDWTYSRGDGEKLYLEMGLQALIDDSGYQWGRLLVFKDKTRIKKMEEDVKRVERLAAIGEMAAGIAHEIRNPLASMSGSLQMLQQEMDGDSDQKLLMNIVLREADRLNLIITDFLAFARPRIGAPSPLDLSRTVKENLSIFECQEHVGNKVEIIESILPGVWVLFDKHQFEQVMWNLLKNAVEAMPDGGRLSIKVTVSGDERPMAVVSVEDTGGGISGEDLSRVFDPFFTTKDSGTGLGLSIVHRIIESGGGRIIVSSNPGRGTRFVIHLPLADHTR